MVEFRVRGLHAAEDRTDGCHDVDFKRQGTPDEIVRNPPLERRPTLRAEIAAAAHAASAARVKTWMIAPRRFMEPQIIAFSDPPTRVQRKMSSIPGGGGWGKAAETATICAFALTVSGPTASKASVPELP